MSLTNDIPTKLRVPSQLALDAKSVVTTLSQLQTLGASNNLAYTYYKGMNVFCTENSSFYMWRPAEVGETGGTLASNFTYPANETNSTSMISRIRESPTLTIIFIVLIKMNYKRKFSHF
jgi:hypothetical protein